MQFFFSRGRRHTRLQGDWSSDVCSSDLRLALALAWLALPFTTGSMAADALHDASRAVQLVASAGLWAGWAAVQIGRASCRGRLWNSGGTVTLRSTRDSRRDSVTYEV